MNAKAFFSKFVREVLSDDLVIFSSRWLVGSGEPTTPQIFAWNRHFFVFVFLFFVFLFLRSTGSSLNSGCLSRS